MPDSPSRVAPASSIATASAAVRMPPLALTPMRSPTVAAMSSTARTDAPPAGMKSRGGLDEVGARVDGGPAHVDQRLLAGEIQQRGRLDDHLEHGIGNRFADRGDVGADGVEVTGEGGADVDDHVDLVGARRDREPGLLRLDRRNVFA